MPLSFLHIAASTMAGGHVRKALGELGRDDEVVDLRDGLQVGPLADVDHGAKQRDAWWQMLSAGVPAWQTFAAETSLDDSALWARLRADPRPVVVWHGPHPGEHLVMLRTCFHLRAHPRRAFEVHLGGGGPRRALPSFYRSVALSGGEVMGAWQHRRRIHDVHARARRWQRIVAHPGCLRDLRQGRIVPLAVDVHDASLRAACVDWTGSTHVLGLVLADLPVGDLFLIWRVRRLLEAGLLAGRGTNEKLGLPGELRSGG
ncbi:MAG: DUF1835 domain-containing protein [Myxococcales bacterium]|nr:DUF1835 domain-containing protein [Myxococcales bacterium]